MELLHIGYYNDIEDLKILYNCDANSIVSYMNNNYGHFYNLEKDLCLYDLKEIEHLNPIFTEDKEYAIVLDIPNDISLLTKQSDFFIDIYKVADEMVSIDKVCEWLKEQDKLCCGEISMILGDNFIEKFKKDILS